MDNFTLKAAEQLNMIQSMLPNMRVIQRLVEQTALVEKMLPYVSVMEQRMLPDKSVMQKLVEQANMMQKVLPDRSVIQGLVEQANVSQRMLQSINAVPFQLARSTEIIAWASVSLSGLTWANIGNALKISDASRIILSNNFLAFSNSYLVLLQSLEKVDLSVLSFPPIFDLPTVEFFNSADLLEAITVEDAEGEDIEEKQGVRIEISMQAADVLQILLADLDVNLVQLWQGANQALDSSNVDRSRHFLISLRELFTHILDQLAPGEQVRAWTASPEHFDKGRPTRKARLLFICRDINYGPFSTFVQKDIESVLEFWEILNRAHQVAIPFTQRQLVAFKIRMEGALRLLLVIWRLGK